MIQIRRNVFETNSSSSHSITLANKQICESRTLTLDDEGYVTLYVNGFCSDDAYIEPVDKLGYVLQTYAAKNKIYLNHAGGSAKFITAIEELYRTEEFKNLEYRIKEIIGPDCKGIRFDKNCGWGYIDDSHEAVDEFCTYSYYDPIDFIFNDYCLHYSYNG